MNHSSGPRQTEEEIEAYYRREMINRFNYDPNIRKQMKQKAEAAPSVNVTPKLTKFSNSNNLGTFKEPSSLHSNNTSKQSFDGVNLQLSSTRRQLFVSSDESTNDSNDTSNAEIITRKAAADVYRPKQSKFDDKTYQRMQMKIQQLREERERREVHDAYPQLTKLESSTVNSTSSMLPTRGKPQLFDPTAYSSTSDVNRSTTRFAKTKGIVVRIEQYMGFYLYYIYTRYGVVPQVLPQFSILLGSTHGCEMKLQGDGDDLRIENFYTDPIDKPKGWLCENQDYLGNALICAVCWSNPVKQGKMIVMETSMMDNVLDSHGLLRDYVEQNGIKIEDFVFRVRLRFKLVRLNGEVVCDEEMEEDEVGTEDWVIVEICDHKLKTESTAWKTFQFGS